MSKIDFDDYAEQYDKLLEKQLRFFEDGDYFFEYKIKTVLENICQRPSSILEYGCGTGRNIRFLQQFFPKAQIYGCDVSPKSLAVAQQENPSAQFFLLPENKVTIKFDLIVIAGVFHHIEPKQRLMVLNEIYSFLDKNGELFIFEHNPYNPVTRYLVNTCPFDKDATLVYANKLKKLLLKTNYSLQKIRYTLFLPRSLKKIRFLEKYLGLLPCGGQYFIHARK